jgi:hypothetical protein
MQPYCVDPTDVAVIIIHKPYECDAASEHMMPKGWLTVEFLVPTSPIHSYETKMEASGNRLEC